MPVLAVDGDELAAFGDIVDHRLLGFELMAQLVEVGHFQLGAHLDLARGRLQVAKQQLEQGGLAGTVGAEQADTVAALQDHGEVAYQRLAAGMGEADVLHHDHLLAGLVRAFQLEAGLALALAALGAFATHFLQCPNPPFVARAAGLDALADPHFFLGQALVEQCVGSFFGGQLLFLVHQETGVVAVPVDQVATIQLEDAGRQGLQEGAVVGNEQHRAVEAQQRFLEPGDGADVQVVGRFVEQQQVRLGDQRLGQQHAPTPAAGEFGEGLVGRQLQAAEGAVHQLLQAPAIARLEFLLDPREARQVIVGIDVQAQVVVLGEQLADFRQTLGHHVEHCPFVGTRQFLGQFADLQRRCAPDFAVVGLLFALDHLEQAGLAGTVAPDHADPLATADLPRHLVQQGSGAKGKGYIGELEQGHGRLRKQGAHFTPDRHRMARRFHRHAATAKLRRAIRPASGAPRDSGRAPVPRAVETPVGSRCGPADVTRHHLPG